MAYRVKRSPDKALFYPKEERYAQERALGCGMREAARRAGLDDYTGIQSKYERKPRVLARIDYLRQNDLNNEYIQAKRRLVEQRLELAAFGNLFECIVIGDDGKPRLDWKKLAESELAVTCGELRFDKENGTVVHVGRDNALAALAQIREMRGYKTVDRHHLEVNQVTQLSDADLERIATRALVETKTIETAALPAPRDDDDDATQAEAGVGHNE